MSKFRKYLNEYNRIMLSKKKKIRTRSGKIRPKYIGILSHLFDLARNSCDDEEE
jgi:hypothetical protein